MKGKRLIYLWDKELYDKGMQEGVCLSGKYKVRFDKNKEEVLIEENPNYVEDFWGNNIVDCTAVVGENGTGKTNLMNILMRNVRKMKNKKENEFLDVPFLILTEENNCLNYYVWKENNIPIKKVINKTQYKIFQLEVSSEHKESFLKWEIAYFHDALSRNDYTKHDKCDFDFSLGREIQRTKNEYEILDYDFVEEFFLDKDSSILIFLIEMQRNNIKIPFPVPDEISVSIDKNVVDFRDVIEILEKNHINKNEKLKEDLLCCRNMIRSVWVKFEEYEHRNLTWEFCLKVGIIKNLILYLLKKCEKSKKKEDASLFKNIIEFMKISLLYVCNEKEISDIYLFLFNNSEFFYSDKNIVKSIHFLEWIDRNHKEFEHLYKKKKVVEDVVSTTLIIQNKEFLYEFIERFSNIYIENLWLQIKFGVSTGEQHFLSLFSQIYFMNHRKKLGYKNSVLKSDTKGVMLIFDEADLSMHPRWQRMYIKWITEFCDQIFDGCSVQIIVTTHSPILLSDFPSHSVLYLSKTEKGKTEIVKDEYKKTFGNNINALFLNSFFLDKEGTIGAFAENKIDKLAGDICQENYEDNEKILDYIGEDCIREGIEQIGKKNGSQKKESYSSPQEKEMINAAIEKIEQQKRSLEILLNQLKEGR